MESSKLDELIGQSKGGIKSVNFASMPSKIELEKQGYHFVDEKEYIANVKSYISVFHSSNSGLEHYMILKRNFESEFEKLGEINKIIPENSVKPIAIVYDNSISNNYIRGYLTKTNGEIYKLKSYLKLKKEKVEDVGSDNITEIITDIENQLFESVNKLKASKIYNKLPIGALSLNNICVTEKNKVILLNINYFMGFSDKNPKYLDKELQKTIRYLEKKK